MKKKWSYKWKPKWKINEKKIKHFQSVARCESYKAMVWCASCPGQVCAKPTMSPCDTASPVGFRIGRPLSGFFRPYAHIEALHRCMLFLAMGGWVQTPDDHGCSNRTRPPRLNWRLAWAMQNSAWRSATLRFHTLLQVGSSKFKPVRPWRSASVVKRGGEKSSATTHLDLPFCHAAAIDSRTRASRFDKAFVGVPKMGISLLQEAHCLLENPWCWWCTVQPHLSVTFPVLCQRERKSFFLKIQTCPQTTHCAPAQ